MLVKHALGHALRVRSRSTAETESAHYDYRRTTKLLCQKTDTLEGSTLLTVGVYGAAG